MGEWLYSTHRRGREKAYLRPLDTALFMEGKVTFSWNNYKCGSRRGRITLQAVEFIRGFSFIYCHGVL